MAKRYELTEQQYARIEVFFLGSGGTLAGASEQGEGWIVEALDTNMSMVTRVRLQFVEEGLEAVLSRKKRASPAITPIFDGEKEARLTGEFL